MSIGGKSNIQRTCIYTHKSNTSEHKGTIYKTKYVIYWEMAVKSNGFWVFYFKFITIKVLLWSVKILTPMVKL